MYIFIILVLLYSGYIYRLIYNIALFIVWFKSFYFTLFPKSCPLRFATRYLYGRKGQWSLCCSNINRVEIVIRAVVVF